MGNGGDVLAKGGRKCQFPPADNVTQERWDAMFKDFNPEVYRRDADVEKTRNAGTESGEVKPTVRR